MIVYEHIVARHILMSDCEIVPYKALLDVYREKLAHEYDAEKRIEIEFTIVVLMAFIELQKDIEAIKLHLSREG